MDSGWAWLLAGVALAIAEIAIPGVFLIWLGMAAILTGGLALGLNLGLPAELGIFAVSACALVVIGRHIIIRSPIISDDPLLNERTARLIGKKVTVVEALVGGEGRVRVADGVWSAVGPDTPAGALVEVVGADGGRLVVEPVIAPRLGSS